MTQAPRDLPATLGFAIISRDAKLQATVSGMARTTGGRFVGSITGAQLAMIEAPCVVVVDHDADDELVRRIGALPRRDEIVVVAAWRDLAVPAPHGVDLVVLEPALREALACIARDTPPVAIALDRLLAASVLQGPIDHAIADAADQLAAGLGVDRVIIALRDDPHESAISGLGRLAWGETAQRCRAAVEAGTTLIAPATEGDEPWASYLAVSLDSAYGRGFIGLFAARPCMFGRDHRDALGGIAARVEAELAWRATHERATDALSRVFEAPGLDQLLGIWNRAAVSQLASMYVSAARRIKLPMTVAIVDVVDLQGINTHHGLKIGDRVLLRIADALRATLRQEDVIGRWSGDEIAVLLHGTPATNGGRVAERINTTLSTRSLELPNGEVIAIEVTIGLTTILDDEEPETSLTRASEAARQAQREGVPIIHVDASRKRLSTGRLSQELEIVREDIGTMIGGEYRLLHEISRGGMGVVYRAEDLALERPVAIKMLRPDFAEDPGLLERLRSEAATLARIQHPNLVQIYSFGQRGGDSYLVMELVEGESLEQAFVRHAAERTVMMLDELVTVIQQAALALDALHERGVIHRDVKPANVIRDPFRARSVLVDVGIASRHGQSREISGTPGFIAPEVIRGEDAGARSDVYGLAATAYAMLTQTLPWGADSMMAVMSRQLDTELVLPSVIRPELEPLDAVIAAGMSLDPDHRPSSAGAFARALAEAAAVLEAPRDGRVARPESAHEPSAPAATIDTAHLTRGVVFRSVTRAMGVREAARVRDALGTDEPELARILADAAPLAWLPTALFVRLLASPAVLAGRDPGRFARDVARATVRASFRRFFPTSAATLVPERTLSAIRNVWGRYHNWGQISSMPVTSTEVVVRLTDTLREPALCEWTSGMIEQLLVLSGGLAPSVEHHACEARGDDACLFRVTWSRGT